MPNLGSYEADIARQGNAPGTHEQMKNLIEWYGSGFREFVEQGDTGKRATPLPGLAGAFKKQITVQPDANGTIKKADGQSLEAFLNAWLGAAGSIAPAANKGIPAYCGRERVRFANLAAADEASAKAAVTAGQNDEASEIFVDAAIESFRAAMCIYYQHQPDLANQRFGQPAARKAVTDFAAAMTKAAELLNDAATNEAPGDNAEIIMELTLAKVFLDSAKTQLNNLQNSGQLPQAEQPAVTAALTKVTNDDAAFDRALNPHLR